MAVFEIRNSVVVVIRVAAVAEAVPIGIGEVRTADGRTVVAAVGHVARRRHTRQNGLRGIAVSVPVDIGIIGRSLSDAYGKFRDIEATSAPPYGIEIGRRTVALAGIEQIRDHVSVHGPRAPLLRRSAKTFQSRVQAKGSIRTADKNGSVVSGGSGGIIAIDGHGFNATAITGSGSFHPVFAYLVDRNGSLGADQLSASVKPTIGDVTLRFCREVDRGYGTTQRGKGCIDGQFSGLLAGGHFDRALDRTVAGTGAKGVGTRQGNYRILLGRAITFGAGPHVASAVGNIAAQTYALRRTVKNLRLAIGIRVDRTGNIRIVDADGEAAGSGK